MRCINVECRVTCWVMICLMWRQFASRRIACQLSTCHISLIVMSHVTHWRTPWHTAPDHSDSWVTGVGAVSWYVIGWLSLLPIVKHEQLKTKGEACALCSSLFKNFTVAAERFICFVCLSLICIEFCLRIVFLEEVSYGRSAVTDDQIFRERRNLWTRSARFRGKVTCCGLILALCTHQRAVERLCALISLFSRFSSFHLQWSGEGMC